MYSLIALDIVVIALAGAHLLLSGIYISIKPDPSNLFNIIIFFNLCKTPAKKK